MIFIFGGKHQGKTAYALKHFGQNLRICDLATDPLEGIGEADLIKNIQEGVRQTLLVGKSSVEYLDSHLSGWDQKILIGTEIGSGIVPLEERERIWRDETGRVYQRLAAQATEVVRVWAGIGVRIK